MHALNIYHNDLKPDNILVFVSNNGQYLFKIADLGLTKQNEM